MHTDQFTNLLVNIHADTIVDLEMIKTLRLRWLLAHAHDGVIWGAFDDAGQLTTSYDIAQAHSISGFKAAQLRASTLQQLRAFGENAELRIWHDGDGWQAVVLHDGDDWIEESQLLWGTQGKSCADWTLLSEGAQGLKHLLPLAWNDLVVPAAPRLSISYRISPEQTLTAALISNTGTPTSVAGWRPARMVVRQTLEYDADGIAFVKHARCVRIEWEQEPASE